MAQSEQEILEGLANIVNEETGLDVGDVQLDKSFTDDLDIDSLSMMTIVVNAEEAFGVRIPDDEVKNLTTVGGVTASDVNTVLRQVNTDGIAPMAHACDVGQRLRDDQVTDGSIEQRDRCLALAPESEAGLYLVPKVIE